MNRKIMMLVFMVAMYTAVAMAQSGPEQLNVLMTDDPKISKVEVVWYGKTHVKYITGTMEENEELLDKWLTKIEEDHEPIQRTAVPARSAKAGR